MVFAKTQKTGRTPARHKISSSPLVLSVALCLVLSACLPEDDGGSRGGVRGDQIEQSNAIEYEIGELRFSIPDSYLKTQSPYSNDLAYIRVLLPDLTPATPETSALLERNDHHRRLIVLLKDLPEQALIKNQDKWLGAVLERRKRPDGAPYFSAPVPAGNGLLVYKNNAAPSGKAKQDVYVSRNEDGDVEFVLICDVPPNPASHTNQSCEIDVPFMNKVWMNVSFTRPNLPQAKDIYSRVQKMVKTFLEKGADERL